MRKDQLFAEDHLRAQRAAEDAVSSTQDMPGFERETFPAHTVIFEENAEADAAYMIVRGKVEIRKNTRSTQPKVLARLGRGDIFGELALFDGSPRLAEAVTQSPVEVIRISRSEFLDRLDSTDKVMKAIVLYVVKCMRAQSSELTRQHRPDWSGWDSNT